MPRSIKKRSEKTYEPGEEAYIMWGDDSVFRVEILSNHCLSGGARALGGISYDLRILEVVKVRNPCIFTTEPKIGLEFACSKVENMSTGIDWKIVKSLE